MGKPKKKSSKKSREFDLLYSKAQELKIAEPTAVRLPGDEPVPRPALESPLSSAPEPKIAPQNTVVSQTTVVGETMEPWSETTVVGETRVALQTTVVQEATVEPEILGEYYREVRGELRIPNTVMDSLLPTLDPFAAAIYLRLFRLSHGHRQTTCLVGLDKLALSTQVSKKTAQRSLVLLEKRGLIRKLGADFGGPIRGGRFEVLLPQTRRPDVEQEVNPTMVPQTTVVPKTRVAPQTTVVSETTNTCAADALKQTHTQGARIRAELIAFGFSPPAADRLMEQSTLEEIERQIKAYPLHAQEKAIKNPLGFLRTAILENWPVPAAYAELTARAEGREVAPPPAPDFDEETVAAYHQYLTQEAEAQVDALTSDELAASKRALLTESIHKDYYKRLQADGMLTPDELRKGLIAERRQVLQANCSLYRFAEMRREEKS